MQCAKCSFGMTSFCPVRALKCWCWRNHWIISASIQCICMFMTMLAIQIPRNVIGDQELSLQLSILSALELGRLVPLGQAEVGRFRSLLQWPGAMLPLLLITRQIRIQNLLHSDAGERTYLSIVPSTQASHLACLLLYHYRDRSYILTCWKRSFAQHGNLVAISPVRWLFSPQ